MTDERPPGRPPPRLEVRGGVAGTAVGLDELGAAAGQLVDAAAQLGEVVVGLVAATASVGAFAPLSPVTAARAGSELALAVRAVAVEAAAVAGVATAVRSAAWAYREVEEEVARTSALAQDVVMAVAGHGAPTLVVGVVVLDAAGVDVGELLDRTVWAVPELAELAGGSGGLVVGLRSSPLTAPFVASSVDPVPGSRSGRSRSGAYDGPAAGTGEVDPDEVDPDEAAVRVLADSATLWGLLDDRGVVRVSAVGASGADTTARAPTGLADLTRDQAGLPADGRVRVVEVVGDHGSAWVVEIAGTQAWEPRAGANPFDVTTDVRSMAAQSTLLAAGVQQALASAQAKAATAQPGRDVRSEPVLLSGHSLGGIVAAGLASSAQFRSAHRVTHVVAMGAPIGKVPVPADVQVMAVEHRQDPVPRLEGRSNPDRAGWVTVTRDLDGTPGPEARASAAHRSERYVETASAVDASDDRSVTTWRAGADRFFPGTGEPSHAVVHDYRIQRLEPPR